MAGIEPHRHGAEHGGDGTLDDLFVSCDDWAESFRLLGDPTRLRLLMAMHHMGPGTLSMSELADRAGVRSATASAALRLLTAAGVVTATRDGRKRRYALTDERIHRLLHLAGGTHADH